jgi:sugar/nucleoside kinase (ribokinase family)
VTGGEPPRVLVVGDVMTDVVVRPEGALVTGADRRATIRTLPGGAGANQAVWLAALGVKARFAGRVGRAEHARQVALLEAARVEVALGADDDLPTGQLVALISSDGERSFFTDRGANERLCREDLPDRLLDGIGLLHVSGYALFSPGPRAAVRELVAEARRRGMFVSVDGGSHSFLEEVGAEAFLEWTRGADICFGNREEARVLTGAGDAGEQLKSLTEHYNLAVVTRGAEGAVAGHGEERWAVPAQSAQVLDTSGAGDAFLAGFLARWLASPHEVEACLRGGTEAAGRAVAGPGSRPWHW